MVISFYTGNICEPLSQMLSDADNNGNFQTVIDYCEPLIGTTEDDGVILCYTYALMENALAVHVDDVEAIGKQCLELLKRVKHTYGGTDHLKVQIKRAIRQAKLYKDAGKELLVKPLDQLSTKEKSKVAYQLAEKGGINNYKQAALIHANLMREDNLEVPYHYGQYVISLYRSKQIELANKTLDELVAWSSTQVNTSYIFLIRTCFEEKMICYTHDKAKMEEIWHQAMQQEIVRQYEFPMAEDNQDELLIAADKLGAFEIKEAIITIIKKHRKPRFIKDEIKKIIEN